MELRRGDPGRLRCDDPQQYHPELRHWDHGRSPHPGRADAQRHHREQHPLRPRPVPLRPVGLGHEHDGREQCHVLPRGHRRRRQWTRGELDHGQGELRGRWARRGQPQSVPVLQRGNGRDGVHGSADSRLLAPGDGLARRQVRRCLHAGERRQRAPARRARGRRRLRGQWLGVEPRVAHRTGIQADPSEKGRGP